MDKAANATSIEGVMDGPCWLSWHVGVLSKALPEMLAALRLRLDLHQPALTIVTLGVLGIRNTPDNPPTAALETRENGLSHQQQRVGEALKAGLAGALARLDERDVL
jgi:hypothetical protein